MDTLWFNIVQWLHTLGLHVDGGTARAVGDAAATATAKLDMPSLLALAAALGWASGFRLYAVVFLVGMMGVLGWMPLPPGLAMLQHPVVLMVSGFMLLVEFFADKVPWVDSAWDAVHAFIRVPAGAALAYGVFGADNASMAMVAGLLGGSLSATSMATKMTTRAAVNTSPEPFSNWGLSFLEDGLVVAVVWLARLSLAVLAPGVLSPVGPPSPGLFTVEFFVIFPEVCPDVLPPEVTAAEVWLPEVIPVEVCPVVFPPEALPAVVCSADDFPVVWPSLPDV